MTIEEFDKAMENIPKIQTNNPISSMNSINVDELRKTAEIFKRIPTFDDLQKENNKLLRENQQLKEQLEASERARNNCYKYLKNPPEDMWSGHSIEKAIELLDIDKGE